MYSITKLGALKKRFKDIGILFIDEILCNC